ncbi:hypothetical protein CFN78_16600 [Amycolatopsis antarctica]|uniref:OmpR/PhoB-type domain-containing protein n=1 Tax=Amycolatopsis antarctica TaxID=1854586 RepID=A0A263D108_9PSEU|nr:winged helix-turn-helix domain-containing protein [Amycolatopsis antarctica]OZM72154.1 hypothetical protein CFN78_16600 [Amycolatopsis antarctica]
MLPFLATGNTLLDGPSAGKTGAVEYCITLLGEFRIDCDGSEIQLPPGKLRSLLAVLALRPDRATTVAETCDYLWDGEPTEAAATTVRSYVKRLRRALAGPAPRSVVVTQQGLPLAREP